ncbi:unnamed protein product [Closterium sp. NIES-65]|nr:unnamed protein product [Closterium sp. NIES-65]
MHYKPLKKAHASSPASLFPTLPLHDVALSSRPVSHPARVSAHMARPAEMPRQEEQLRRANVATETARRNSKNTPPCMFASSSAVFTAFPFQLRALECSMEQDRLYLLQHRLACAPTVC